MRTTFQLTMLAAAVTALGCSTPSEDREPAHQGSAELGTGSRAMQMSRMNGARALRDAVRSNTEIGGLVTVFDDPLTNTHGFSQALFFNQHVPIGCTRAIPIEGGTCEQYVVCDPPEPDFTPQLVDVGAIDFKSTFDAFHLEPAFFHDAESRSGPFWRGDGDVVTMSFAGTTELPQAWSTTMAAPVADAVSHVPSSVDRGAGLELTWRYATGAAPAVGKMAVVVAQTDPPRGSIECLVPMTQRSMKIPAQMLTRFVPGPGSVMMTSTATKFFGTPIGAGGTQIVVALTGTVDIGNPDQTDSNVQFR
jgi:hypothetical protein